MAWYKTGRISVVHLFYFLSPISLRQKPFSQQLEKVEWYLSDHKQGIHIVWCWARVALSDIYGRGCSSDAVRGRCHHRLGLALNKVTQAAHPHLPWCSLSLLIYLLSLSLASPLLPLAFSSIFPLLYCHPLSPLLPMQHHRSKREKMSLYMCLKSLLWYFTGPLT